MAIEGLETPLISKYVFPFHSVDRVMMDSHGVALAGLFHFRLQMGNDISEYPHHVKIALHTENQHVRKAFFFLSFWPAYLRDTVTGYSELPMCPSSANPHLQNT